MKIYPIKNIIKPITFGNNKVEKHFPQNGFLSTQSSDKLNFEKNLELTTNADAVQSNPLKALGYKFARAYKILFSKNNENDTYIHLPYMA